MYSLQKHQQYIEKISDELSGYPDIDSLRSVELEKLPYLNAIIRESLRMFPPFGSPAGRVCPPEGRTVNGHFIPGGVFLI
jgi:cytochrome P450